MVFPTSFNIVVKSYLVSCIWSWFSRLTWLWGACSILVPGAAGPCLGTLHHHHHRPPNVSQMVIKRSRLLIRASHRRSWGILSLLLGYLRAWLSRICCGDIFWSVPALSGTVSPLSGLGRSVSWPARVSGACTHRASPGQQAATKP